MAERSQPRVKQVARAPRLAAAGVKAATFAAQDSTGESGQEDQEKVSESGIPLALKGGNKKTRTGKTKQTKPVVISEAPLRFVFKLYEILT